MRTHRRRITPLLALAGGLIAAPVVAASATAIHALSTAPDGTHLRATWTNGGQAQLELEDRNVEPAICFVWENNSPNDGDSIASRILTRAGAEVVDLGTGDQWIQGVGAGCEIPQDTRYRDVFANPSNYIVEFRVVENQGTPATGPVRSGPLEQASG
ncbi:hypothetical protein [Terrabacter sp. BE26]|uniref:hypothetical protein n=1 Tax=Terrabacter sp. BE26 TaxID=2898152 RepID=UPI0035BE6781